MDYRELLKLKPNEWQAYYLFTGEEAYLINETKRYLINFIDEGFRDFNYQSFEDESVNEIKLFLEKAPMMSDKKLAVINNYSQWAKKNKTDIDHLIEILPTIPQDTTLIINADTKDIDKRTKFYKFFKNNNTIVEFKRPNEREFKAWVKKKIFERGRTIDEKTLMKFIELTGYLKYQSEVSLYYVENEVDKLCQMADKMIDEEIIDRCMNRTPDDNIFRFLDSFFIGDQKAILYYHELINASVPKERIFYMMLRESRLIYELSLLLIAMPEKEAISKLKLSSFEGRKLSQLSRRRKVEEWEVLFKKLEEIDYSQKTQVYDLNRMIELLTLKNED